MLDSYSQAIPEPTLIGNCDTILHKILSYLQIAFVTFKMDKTIQGKYMFHQIDISVLES